MRVADLWARKRVLALIAIVALLASFGLAAYRLMWKRPPFSIDAVQFTKLSDSGTAEIAAISPDGRYIAYTTRRGEKVGLWLRQSHGGLTGGVQILPPEALGIWGLTFSPDGNYIFIRREVRKAPNFKNLYRIPFLGGNTELITSDVCSAVSFSPDGKEFVFERCLSRGGIDLKTAKIDGSGERVLTTFPTADTIAYYPGPTWSPDGKTIAVPVVLASRGWKLDLIKVANGSIQEIWSNPLPIGHAVWLPDGDTLLVPIVSHDSIRGELWTISVRDGKGQRFTNDLTDYSPHLDITRNGKVATATASTWAFNIWTFEPTDLGNGRQITFGELPMLEIAELPDGSLVSMSQGGVVWVVRADGSDRRMLTKSRGREPMESCGESVLFPSDLDSLTRVDVDGAEVTRRVDGGVIIATCTPDGKSILYVTKNHPQKIMQVSVKGGYAVEIAKVRGEITNGRIALSPDQRFLAYVSVEGSPGLTVAHVVRRDGGVTVNAFELPGSLRVRKLNWSPSGKGLQYLIMSDGVMNIWEQPLDGKAPYQVTHFTSGLIFSFIWSSYHRHLLMTRGTITNDVVLLEFRQGNRQS